MNSFPRVDLPGVTEEERATVRELIDAQNLADEIMRRNKANYLKILLSRGITHKPTFSHRRKRRPR